LTLPTNLKLFVSFGLTTTYKKRTRKKLDEDTVLIFNSIDMMTDLSSVFTCPEIAELLNVSSSIVVKRMTKLGVKRKLHRNRPILHIPPIRNYLNLIECMSYCNGTYVCDLELYNRCMNDSKTVNSFSKNQKFLYLLKEQTKWLTSDRASVRLRIDCVRSEMTEYPKCAFCENNTSVSSHNDYFSKHCSVECQSKSLRFEHPKLTDRDWLYKVRVAEKRSWEEIAKMLDTVSGRSIKRAAIGFDLPDVNCSNSSADERELLAYVQSIYDGEVISGDRTVLNGKEIDIYLPQLKIGFEYNGLRFHTEEFRDKYFHQGKTRDAAKKGVTLFHIWSDDYNDHKDIWKSRIEYMVNKTKNKIYARKCEIREIDNKTKKEFLNQNHLQGNDSSKVKLVLYHNDELVSVMTFAKCRFGKKYDYELVRFANKTYVSVCGGFSKLLKQFRKMYTGSIVSYADLSYSNGGVYEKNGFEVVAVRDYGYTYTKTGREQFNRMSFTKAAMKRKFPDHVFLSDNELDMTHELGYSRIYKCGTATYMLI